MGPGVDMREKKRVRGLASTNPPPPRPALPRYSPANERSRGRNKFNLSGRVLIYPTCTCSCVVYLLYASSLSVKIAAGWFRSPALGLRIICHVVPSDSLQLSPPTLLTRAPLLSFSGLRLLKAVGAGYPFPLSPPSLRERLKDRTPTVESALAASSPTPPKDRACSPDVAGDLQ